MGQQTLLAEPNPIVNNEREAIQENSSQLEKLAKQSKSVNALYPILSLG